MEHLDELVAAVVRKLPPPGGPFPAEAREAWLKLMAMAFDISYGLADNVLPFPTLSVVTALPAGGSMSAASDRHAGRPYNEEFTVGKPVSILGPPRFYISKDGRALKDPGANPVRAVEVPHDEIIYDERPEGRRDLDTIVWADGTWPAEALPPLTLAG